MLTQFCKKNECYLAVCDLNPVVLCFIDSSDKTKKERFSALKIYQFIVFSTGVKQIYRNKEQARCL